MHPLGRLPLARFGRRHRRRPPSTVVDSFVERPSLRRHAGTNRPRRPSGPYNRVTLGSHSRYASRRLRNHGPARRGRYGRGLSGDRHEAQTPGRHQDPAAFARGGSGSARTFSARSRSARVFEPSEHRRHLRAGRDGGATASSWNWSRAKTSRIGLREVRSLSRGAADREADRRSARSRAPERHHPPRPEAGQHPKIRADDPGEVARLRLRERRRAGERRCPLSTSMSPTITTPAMTERGVILGTAAYMSPEQARGQVGRIKRTDIWAFGCVLFEMLTGTPRVRRAKVSPTRWRASWSVSPTGPLFPRTPPHRSGALLQRCLRKDPQKRLRDIADVRLESMTAIQSWFANSPVTRIYDGSSAHRRPERLAWVTAAFLVGSAAGCRQSRRMAASHSSRPWAIRWSSK